MRGRAESGHSGGSKGEGYNVVGEFGERGEAVRGKRTINEVEARIVRRIFNEYLAGKSAKKIAGELNEEGVPGPRSGTGWSQSTIDGNWRRGNGILIFFPASRPRGPPHSVVLTDRLSIAPADGLASRPSASRARIGKIWLIRRHTPLSRQG